VRVTTPSLPDEEAPAAVVVGRAVGGLLLVIAGLVVAAAGAFVLFVAPLVAPFTDLDSIWWTLSDLDFVGAIVGGLGLVGAFIGGGLIQRARRKRMQVFMDSEDLANVQSVMSLDLSKKAKPADPAPPTIV
jgi:hypothetical protein